MKTPVQGAMPHVVRPVGKDETSRFELRFVALANSGRGLAFPCDADGRVDIDTLSGRARVNYFYARSAVGREFHGPAVQRVDDEH